MHYSIHPYIPGPTIVSWSFSALPDSVISKIIAPGCDGYCPRRIQFSAVLDLR